MRICLFVVASVALLLPWASSAAAAPPTLLAVGQDPPLTGDVPSVVVTSASGDDRGTIRVSWTLPAGVEAWNIEIGRDDEVDSGGSYSLASMAVMDRLLPTQTSYTTRPQPPGTYYVHVLFYPRDWGVTPRWSGTQILVVPDRPPDPPLARARAGNASSAIHARTSGYVREGKRFEQIAKTCREAVCNTARIRAFARLQATFERFVAWDIAQARVPCKAAAGGLLFELGRSEEAMGALARSLAQAEGGAAFRAVARKAGAAAARAIRSTRPYVAECSAL